MFERNPEAKLRFLRIKLQYLIIITVVLIFYLVQKNAHIFIEKIRS